MTHSHPDNAWSSARLGDVTSVGSGTGFPTKWQGSTNGLYPFYKVSDMNLFGNEVWMLTHNNAIDESTRAKLKARTHPKGTIIFPKIGAAIATNKKRILAKDSCFDNNVIGIHPSSQINTNFLFNLLLCKNLSEFANTGNPPSIRKTTLEDWEISFPPLTEQKRIAEILDTANALRTKRRESLAQLDALLQSTFFDFFGDPVTNTMGWEVKNLEDISIQILSGTTPKGGKQVYTTEGVTFFRSQNVWRNRLAFDDIAYIDEEIHRKMAKSSLKKKDILITKTGRFNTENSSLGRAAMFLGPDDSANINGHVYLVRLEESCIHEFVLFILTSNEYREYIRRVCVGGIDKRQINKAHLNNFPIISPPIDLQRRFTDIAESVERQKARQRAHLGELDTLFASLQSRAFRGDL